MKRKRKYFEQDKIYPIYFTDNYIVSPIEFIEEKFVDIDGVKKDHYIINTLGEMHNKKGDIIKPKKINSGYYVYNMSNGKKGKDKKYKHMLVHRLVKLSFDPIDNFNEMTVNHINMNKSDCRLSNLEYMTQKENNDAKYKTVLDTGTERYNAAFTREQLKIIVEELDKGEKTYREILELIGIEYSKHNCDYIGNIKRGITYKEEVKEIRTNSSSTTSRKT